MSMWAEKWSITVVILAWWLLMPQVGYSAQGDDTEAHLLYMISHANVWHLAGNLFVLWVIRGRLFLMMAVVIGFLMSFVPAMPGLWGAPDGVTMGLSGVLFAVIGIKWGAYFRGEFALTALAKDERKANDERTKSKKREGERKAADVLKRFCLKVLPFAFLGAIVPHVNWSLHLYCLLAGALAGTFEIDRPAGEAAGTAAEGNGD